jgi:FlaA1/EpsC-like NDP-sugar epimerase/dTDP-4-amino-4,6-dideoxygalactose transaminase
LRRVRGDATSGAKIHSKIAHDVYGLFRDRSNTSLRILDTGVVAVAWLVGYLAGFDGALPFGIRRLLPYLVLAVAIQLVCNELAGLYGPVWRYASVEEAIRVVGAVAVGAALSTLTLLLLAPVRDVNLPLLSAPPTAALLMLVGLGGLRFQSRLFALERQQTRANKLRTLIVGATPEGAALARELTQRPALHATAVGFVDDDAQLTGRSVRGLPVFGNTYALEQICAAQDIDRVVIALPHASRDHLRDVVSRSLRTDAQVKILADAAVPEGEPLLDNLRNLDPADLLGREPELVDSAAIESYLENATVLVTGAGGSIGSEIAHQVLTYAPRKVLLLDRDESLLFETMAAIVDERAQPLLADIRDDVRMGDVFDTYRPDVVFHAAAHKHVPILEAHPAEAVETNLLATWMLAQIAAKYGCRFIQISTDKAAAPCSVMGATKRAAEQTVLAVGQQDDLPFSAVRFGNVLNSRGSVVPTFFRQILEGGPITVTDPEMTRFFMTIPEAVRLVLQAGAMAEERRLFLLDMGEPVKIMDLARQMVRMSGLRPGRDIEIKVVGARPGERLHEQLYDENEMISPTWHPAIRSVSSHVPVKPESLFSELETLRVRCVDAGGAEVRRLLRDLLAACGVDYKGRPAGASARGRDGELIAIDLTAKELSPDGSRARPRNVARPALVGGESAFESPLPFARPTRPPLQDVTNALKPSYDAGILTNGPLVRSLEERLADRLGVRDVVAVSSCTSGLMLVLQAIVEDRPGPVVLPSFTFSASAHAVSWNARAPRFVDCLFDTLQIDLADSANALGDASALLATHIFGAPCNPEGVVAVANARGVPVVFDAAHALGALTRGKPIGGFGVAEVFSLTPTKPLVAGEGGIVATNDAALAEIVRVGRDYGNPGDYNTRFPGLSARMSEFHAAIALLSLDTFDAALARRNEIAALYRAALSSIPGIRPQVVAGDDFSTYKDFAVIVDAEEYGVSRNLLVRALRSDGIDTRNYFDPPVHQQESYSALEHRALPVTDEVAEQVIALPMSTALEDDQIERVADVIASVHVYADAIRARHDRYLDTPSRGVRMGRSMAVMRR